ncbi:MAG: hypothetical protein DI539_25700 [Flavobacterium psychrophilum]|jgi:4'-phosphopantetheinyl transferase|nr:MAG: hypothetical protein DI539_25700 [Flavobacterium psychrophilum]
MIRIYYCFLTNHVTEFLDVLVPHLPIDLRTRFHSFVNRQDGFLMILGRLLALKGIRELSGYDFTLADIKLTKYKRPYVNDLLDFNITHSGNLVLCIVSDQGKVGIDAEEIISVSFDEFESILSTEELVAVNAVGSKPCYPFFQYWTEKEAVLKAIGQGFLYDNSRIREINSKKSLEELRLQLRTLSLLDSYVINAAIPNDQPGVIEIEEVSDFGDFSF